MTAPGPLAAALTAIAARPLPAGPLPARLLALAERDLPALRAPLCANPSVPTAEAARLCGLTGGTPDPHAVAAFTTRADLPEDQLERALRVLAAIPSGRDTHPLAALAQDPATSARVLLALEPLLRRAGLPRYVHSRLLQHPNATPALVVAVLSTISAALPAGADLAAGAGFGASLFASILAGLDPVALRAAFDALTHPGALVDLAEARPAMLDPDRAARLLRLVLTHPGGWPGLRAFTKTHPVARAADLARDVAPEPVRAEVAAALDARRVRIRGGSVAAALGVPAPAQPVGNRRFTVVARDARDSPAVADALTAHLAGLDESQWVVFCAMADSFSGTITGLLEACAGVAAPAGS